MANFIEICFIFLTTNLWFAEAYSGIRHRRSKTHHEEESDIYVNKPSLDDKASVVRRAINDNEIPLTEDMENNDMKKIVKRAISYNENGTADGDSWADLCISFVKLAMPFIPEQIKKLNLDWPQLENAVRSFSHVTSSDVTERSSFALINDSPLMATIRATTAAATPMIMDGVRSLLGMLLDLVDNAGFVTNGHAISRRGVSEGVLDDIMDAFTAILEHITGAK